MPYIIEDEASGFWTGKPWLVILEDDQPPLASFKTDAEAFDFLDEYDREQREVS